MPRIEWKNINSFAATEKALAITADALQRLGDMGIVLTRSWTFGWKDGLTEFDVRRMILESELACGVHQ